MTTMVVGITCYAPASEEVTNKNPRTGKHIQAGQPLMDLIEFLEFG